MAKKTVTLIPAVKPKFSSQTTDTGRKRRVAAYARVSTDSDEQFTSFEAQVDYYTKLIKERQDWLFVDVYTDEGISGTSTKHRAGFNKMIEDALDGQNRPDRHKIYQPICQKHHRYPDNGTQVERKRHRGLF